MTTHKNNNVEKALSIFKRKVKDSDVYDLASLTKILASLPLIMKAEEDKKISLNSKLKDILIQFKRGKKRSDV